jgi:cellulose synthase/poly-beta-1,6-N-acetylglucosamine synthase-like glycosyltransferase
MDILLIAVLSLVALITLLNRSAKIFLILNTNFSPKRKPPVSLDCDKTKLLKVSFHIAISNEDPGIVIKTLSALAKVDYPNYIVIVIDNNTRDVTHWKPVEQFCKKQSERFIFYHVDQLKGYKAGALNYALEYTPQDCQLIAIVDADNIVKSEFLKDTVGCFRDKKVAFVQTPLGFEKDPEKDSFNSWIFLIYRYFLSIYMPAANRFNCAPFIGSMGIIRRSVLEKVGGWKGFYLTEDMEISYRIFSQGFTSRFINFPYGCSMPPMDFFNFKKQHYRWNFGNMQIWRDYILKLLRDSWGTKHDVFRKFLYFACPGIYINFYFLPFTAVALTLHIAEVFNYHFKITPLLFYLLLVTLAVEMICDMVFFFILGYHERVSFRPILKNLISWWGLSLNNTLSTYAAIIKPTRPFEITGKGGKSIKKSKIPAFTELLLTITLLFSLILPLIVSPQPMTFVSPCIYILGILSLSTFFLPTTLKN